MAIVSAICTKCGTLIEVDDVNEASICPFCREAFVTEKAIEKFCVNSSSNKATNSVMENEFDRFKKKIDAYKKIGDKDNSILTVNKMVEAYPDKWESWFCKIEVLSNSFTKDYDYSDIGMEKEIEDCVNAVKKLGCNNQEALMKINAYQDKVSKDKNALNEQVLRFINTESQTGIYFDSYGITYGLEIHYNQLHIIESQGPYKRMKEVTPYVFSTGYVRFKEKFGYDAEYKYMFIDSATVHKSSISVSIDDIKEFQHPSGNLKRKKWYKNGTIFNKKEDERGKLKKITDGVFDFINKF